MTISFARKALLGTALAASVGIGYAIGAQPHMGETITLLQSARAELAAATPNKGGHREKALGLIDQAIAEVRAGIAFASGLHPRLRRGGRWDENWNFEEQYQSLVSTLDPDLVRMIWRFVVAEPA